MGGGKEQKAERKGKKGKSEVAQLCPTLCDPVDCRPPGSSVHGISQASIMEWVAISFSRPRDKTHVSWSAGIFFTTGPPGKPNLHIGLAKKFVWV